MLNVYHCKKNNQQVDLQVKLFDNSVILRHKSEYSIILTPPKSLYATNNNNKAAPPPSPKIKIK